MMNKFIDTSKAKYCKDCVYFEEADRMPIPGQPMYMCNRNKEVVYDLVLGDKIEVGILNCEIERNTLNDIKVCGPYAKFFIPNSKAIEEL